MISQAGGWAQGKIVLWLAWGLLGCAVSGCAADMSFARSNMFFGESLELRRDGTFQYSSSSDEIGMECNAAGDWRKLRRDGIQYIVLEVKKLNRAENCRSVTGSAFWLISHGGIMNVSGAVIPRR